MFNLFLKCGIPDNGSLYGGYTYITKVKGGKFVVEERIEATKERIEADLAK